MERNLALELARVTEAAALSAAREAGRGDEVAAERIAGEAIAKAFSGIGDVQGEIVVGDPQAEENAPLATGARLGDRGEDVDIAVDPLEGSMSCALGGPNAMSVMALAEKGKLLRCSPGVYMDKIATGADGRGVVDLDATPEENLKALAEVRGCYVGDLTVVVLDRPRHDGLIDTVRAAGARVKLIHHGDVSAALAAARPGGGADLLLGSGGASQGVLAAAAIKCMGGFMQGRFTPRRPGDRKALFNLDVEDPDAKLELDDMAGGNILFAATGVTDGDFLQGVDFVGGGAISHSVVMRSQSGTVRYLTTHHAFDYAPEY